MSVSNFLKYDMGQHEVPRVDIGTAEERLAAQARKVTRLLNSKLIRPKTVLDVPKVISNVIGWYFKKPGPGRPKMCATIDEAMHLQMDVHGAGRIGPRFAK